VSYSSQAQLSGDLDFLARVSAAAAVEVALPVDPQSWARAHIWRISASPGFAAAYESALAGNVPRPGNDPAVIPDADITAAVQATIAAEATP
jgi:negative regulator of sigma E activity